MNRFSTTLILLAAGCILAADSPFDGTWKLVPAKSHFTGDTFTYTAAGDKLSYSNGSTLAFDFALDGQPYATPFGTTESWTKAGENAWDREWKMGDRVLTRGRTTLSKDGRKLLSTYTEFRPDGTQVKTSDEYRRTSGGPGLAGTWRNIKTVAVPDQVIVKVPAPGQLSYVYPAYRFKVEGPTDGSLLTPMGPNVPKEQRIAFRTDTPTRFTWEAHLGDKVTDLGGFEVSKDGRAMTITSWSPGKEQEKAIAVYARQKPPAYLAPAAVAKELTEVEHRWAEAMVKNDPSMIEKHMASEFVFQFGYGRVPKEDDLHGGSFNGDWRAQAFSIDPTEIRAYGDTALVLGNYAYQATIKGQPVAEKGLFADVFVKRGGTWVCVLGQTTPELK